MLDHADLLEIAPAVEVSIPRAARMSGNLGFETWVVGDACATFDREGPDGEVFPADLIHRTALASLHDEFADVITTDEATARLA